METLNTTPFPIFNYATVSLTDYSSAIVIEYVSDDGIPWCQECMMFHDEDEF